MFGFGTWKRKLEWRARKKQYSAVLEESLKCLNPATTSPDELAAITAVIQALKEEEFKIFHSFEIERKLCLLWQPSMPDAMSGGIPPQAASFPRAINKRKFAEQWVIAMPREFQKSIQNIDRKLQGRILQAISEICQNPMTPRGDTVKPLDRNMHGFWRYRVGDHRLIYQPVPERNEVILVDFDARGSVYG